MRYSKENHVGKILIRGDVIKLKRRGNERKAVVSSLKDFC